jgi:hypothetical protein
VKRDRDRQQVGHAVRRNDLLSYCIFVLIYWLLSRLLYKVRAISNRSLNLAVVHSEIEYFVEIPYCYIINSFLCIGVQIREVVFPTCEIRRRDVIIIHGCIYHRRYYLNMSFYFYGTELLSIETQQKTMKHRLSISSHVEIVSIVVSVLIFNL